MDKTSIVEEKLKELYETGVLPLEFDEDFPEDVNWGLIMDDGKIISDSGQCCPDTLTEEEAKIVIARVFCGEENK